MTSSSHLLRLRIKFVNLLVSDVFGNYGTDYIGVEGDTDNK